MEATEAVIWATLALFGIAFVIRMAAGIWKIIWDLAPIAVPLIILALYMVANNIPIYDTYEMEVKDANHIESIENPSGRSED